MIFCCECFNDIELKSCIKGLDTKGNCSICNQTDTYIYNTDIDSELVDYFEELISIYTPINLLTSTYPKKDLNLLKDELLNRWNIFNNLNASQIYNIITQICKDKYIDSPDLFDNPIGIAELHDTVYLSEKSLLKTDRWEDFVDSLKKKNRFHTKHINTTILKEFCSYLRKPYKKGMIFYRGRISSYTGYSPDLMGAPCFDSATAGRANAMGIRCLYLSDNIKTVIHEVRAGAFDYVSVGTFELLNDIIVVDLKSIDKISPFIHGLNYIQHAINKEHLKKINTEMAKTLRRSDSPLDYIPTQYISDFIKSIEHHGNIEYSGLEYNSAMNKDGFNLAVFYPELFKCINVEVYEIKDLNYIEKKIK